ncbi:DNA ligase B [bacterium HR34]|nr:DNA ligase B [bacterium HR34]
MKNKETSFLELAQVFELLEKTSSSLEMRDILAKFLAKIAPKEVQITAYLLQGKLGPDYKNIEFGLAEKLVLRAITGDDASFKKLSEEEFKKTGDLGIVAKLIREKIEDKPKNLSIEDVYNKLFQIASFSGTGSQDNKLRHLFLLIRQVSPIEAKYIIRIVLGTLRLGVAEMTFIYALSKGFTGTYANKEKIEHAFNVVSDLGEISFILAKEGLKAIENIKPEPGVPIRMMLAQRVADIEEIKKHIPQDMIVEYKYDGERVQAHMKSREEVFLYSRRHENITHQFPEIVKNLKETFKGKNVIVEGEIVAYDKEKDELLPFQELMKRRRKYEISLFAEKIPTKIFLFDIIYKNNKSLLGIELETRKDILKESFNKNEIIDFSKFIKTNDISDVENFFDEAIDYGAEGVMVKNAEGIYQAGTRGWLWIKFKKDYVKGLADTFDLVVIGGEYGTGRRAGTYGSLMVAAFDPETNKYYSFTKVGAGFTDEDLKNIPEILDKYKIKDKHRLVSTNMEVDVWFEPQVVMEVSGAELTISPVHTVAQDKIKTGGLALRFPRFIRWRDDKSPEQATTVQEIYDIYKRTVLKKIN